jgi:hypothetical protein
VYVCRASWVAVLFEKSLRFLNVQGYGFCYLFLDVRKRNLVHDPFAPFAHGCAPFGSRGAASFAKFFFTGILRGQRSYNGPQWCGQILFVAGHGGPFAASGTLCDPHAVGFFSAYGTGYSGWTDSQSVFVFVEPL